METKQPNVAQKIKLRDNSKRAKIAMVMIGVVLAGALLSLLSAYWQWDLLSRGQKNPFLFITEGKNNDSREAGIAILHGILYIISAVTFIQWFRRAYFNLHLKSDKLSFAEGWAAGAWFVPIINLFRPFQIMKELYQETANIIASGSVSLKANLSTNIVMFYWGIHIAGSLIGSYIYVVAKDANPSIDVLIHITQMSMVADLCIIASGILLIKIIADYSKVEPLLAETDLSEMVTINSLVD